MRLILSSSGISRRALLSTLAALAALPSWTDGPAKQAIVELVKVTTDRASPKFVPPEERIATFHQDGTTWVEHPIYTQVMYCLERVPAVVAKKPELKNVEPFKTVLSGNREAIAKLSTKDLMKILAVTLSGMTVDAFKAEVTNWIATAKLRDGTASIPSWPTSQCSKSCGICARMATKPISSPAAGKTLSASIPSGSMVFRPSKSWARRAA